MLWSLIKILLFVAIIAGLIFGVDILTQQGEGMRIAIGATEYTLGPLQAAIAAMLLLGVVWLVLKLVGLLVAALRFLGGDETAITRYFARNRERAGFRALTEGLTALAAGDGVEALAKANKAEKLLQRPDLTNLIAAQAAELSGDRSKATDAYKRLLADDRTRFVGVRGLMKQKLADGDTETALKLAEKAFVLKPKHSETSDTLLQLQAKHSNWKGARKTLGAKLKHGTVPKDLHKRRDAVLAVSEAQHRLAAGDAEGARDEAIEAQRLSPALIPAAVAAARAYIDLGKPRNAAKVLKTAWDAEPHPDLAAVFAEIVPDESPTARVKRFAELTKLNPDQPEARMLRAELNLAAEDFPAARKALGQLAETAPTARSLTLMAAIERGEGADDSTVRAWLAKALGASRGPQWICENCGHVHKTWVAICTNCDAFDTLAWKTAKGGEAVQGDSAAMLPLIIGGPAKAPHAQPEVEAEPETEPVDPTQPPVDVLPEPAWDSTAAENDAAAAKRAKSVN